MRSTKTDFRKAAGDIPPCEFEVAMDAGELAQACAAKMWEGDQVRRALGITLVSVGPGAATVRMEVRQDMLNSHEMCHGGMIFTLADTAFAYACNSYDASAVAQNCSVSFVAPGKLGDVLTATGREVSRVGRSGIYDISVMRQDGRVIAEFRGLSRTIGGSILAEDWRKPKG
jgi:acyl-CoA thioesterase